MDSENSRLHFRLGVVYDKMGRRHNSIDAMKTVVRLRPDNADALNYLGYTYADMGINLDEAESLIQNALKIKPQDGYITDSLGWVYYKRGQYRQALEYLMKAVDLVPDDPVILEHIGDVHRKMNNAAEALDYYRRSIDKSSKNRNAIEDKIRSLK
jgi:tetratricopeptide (TPR) repeat protein